MRTFAPEYYKKFKCLAGECKHSCCIGWEIEVDEITLENYMKVDGNLGERLKNCISKGKESFFVLDENERCPFLNENGLCDIYIELGEKNLCDICKDHPRFRNFFESRTEIGLGLCCEAATELVLEWEKPFSLLPVDGGVAETKTDDAETVFFALREKAFEIIQDDSISAEKCGERLLETFGTKLPRKGFEEWLDIFLGLEILDGEWKKILENARTCRQFDFDMFRSRKGQNFQRQLLLYFVYRHTADGMYDGTFGARLSFGVLGLNIIKYLCAAKKEADFEYFKDIARHYSAEIEYSQENTERIINIISGNL